MVMKRKKAKAVRWFKNKCHFVRSLFAVIYFGFPANKIKIIGVTGTNGKTTTIQMIDKILEQDSHRVAMASTINFKFAKKEWVNETKFTTLSAWEVQKFIKRAVEERCEYLILEVSSHALDQCRLFGIDFDVAVITNVTREHLDYHHTMGEYRCAKAKLFAMLKEDGLAVINLDMKEPEEFIEISKDRGAKILGYTTSEKVYEEFKEDESIITALAEGTNVNIDGSVFTVRGERFFLRLPGIFNVENALAAICAGSSQGVYLRVSRQALDGIEKVSGRMDYIENERDFRIVIDYAVTPDSMEKIGELLETSKQRGRVKKLIWVFGSCGERDRGKRPIMGEIVAKYADFTIVTNEDPYNEDPMRIIEEVFAGVIKGGKVEGTDCWKILRRREAIKKALEMAKEGDLVLVTGKGAEETMAVGKERLPWNDKKVIKELLEELPL